MFSNLTDFSYQRTGKQAVGFYFAYLGMLLVCGFLVGFVWAIVTGINDFAVSVRVGQVLGVIAVLTLSFLVLKNKKLIGEFKYILLLLLSGVLAIFGGGLIGLILVAYLTTQKGK